MKGAGEMRIAVTFENGEVFQHFGHTEQFMVYDVADGQITKEQVIDTARFPAFWAAWRWTP